MICIKFMGGLGNQMFQYAMYLFLKKQYPKSNVKIDIDSYKYVRYHTGFDLKRVFDVSFPNYDLKEQYSKWNALYYKIKVNLKKHFCLLNILGIKSFNGDVPYINKTLFRLNDNKYNFLYGTWETDCYMSYIESEIREKYVFPTFLLAKNIEAQKEMESVNSVSIHIRRGDYLNSKFVDLTQTKYYSDALEYVKEKIGDNIKLFIFSDDIDWCRSNLEYGNLPCVFIDWNKGDFSYEDMHLMALCKCNILANSTFSWWAGYLNMTETPLIICPRQYYKDENYNIVFINYHYPKKWVKM